MKAIAHQTELDAELVMALDAFEADRGRGPTARELADEVDITRKAVYRHLDRLGLRHRLGRTPRRMPPFRKLPSLAKARHLCACRDCLNHRAEDSQWCEDCAQLFITKFWKSA